MIGPARERIEFLRAPTSTAKRVTGLAAERVTARDQSDARFTRILVGYSVTEIIFVSRAAEARAMVGKETASGQAPAELQECSARRDLPEFLD